MTKATQKQNSKENFTGRILTTFEQGRVTSEKPLDEDVYVLTLDEFFGLVEATERFFSTNKSATDAPIMSSQGNKDHMQPMPSVRVQSEAEKIRLLHALDVLSKIETLAWAALTLGGNEAEESQKAALIETIADIAAKGAETHV